jgi:hypothetical protein
MKLFEFKTKDALIQALSEFGDEDGPFGLLTHGPESQEEPSEATENETPEQESAEETTGYMPPDDEAS